MRITLFNTSTFVGHSSMCACVSDRRLDLKLICMVIFSFPMDKKGLTRREVEERLRSELESMPGRSSKLKNSSLTVKQYVVIATINGEKREREGEKKKDRKKHRNR